MGDNCNVLLSASPVMVTSKLTQPLGTSNDTRKTAALPAITPPVVDTLLWLFTWKVVCAQETIFA